MNSLIRPMSSLSFRQTHLRRTDIAVGPGSVLLYGVFEQRSEINADWTTLFGDANTYEILADEGLQSARIPKFSDGLISLRNKNELRRFVDYLNASEIYLDITGLPHHIWMPLVRVCLEADVVMNCIYVEPKSYTYNPTPKPGDFFDLSEKILGFSPIPTFARLTARRSDEAILVPLLGFEGIRFRHLIERIEPSERDISPVVGVPGFELEYPFHTYEGNATVLSSTRSWQRVNYVDAACPFALFEHLGQFQSSRADRHLQIATIGTKPHALGATIYAIQNPGVEILYDHPVKRKGRTTGMSKCHLYKISGFLKQF